MGAALVLTVEWDIDCAKLTSFSTIEIRTYSAIAVDVFPSVLRGEKSFGCSIEEEGKIISLRSFLERLPLGLSVSPD
jgi:hypothetical protein